MCILFIGTYLKNWKQLAELIKVKHKIRFGQNVNQSRQL